MPPGSLATLPPSLQTHCALLALVLPPDIAFSHLTAAALWGWRLPGPPHRMPTIDIIRPSGQPRIRRPGLVSHRGMEQREIVCVDGLRLTSELPGKPASGGRPPTSSPRSPTLGGDAPMPAGAVARASPGDADLTRLVLGLGSQDGQGSMCDDPHIGWRSADDAGNLGVR